MHPASVSFRNLTTFRVGGDIAQYEHLDTLEDVCAFFGERDRAGDTLRVMGSGSNILASDDPFEGTVVSVGAQACHFESEGDTVRVVAEAGMLWDALVSEAVSRDLWGFENLSAIPGTVGASPIQNIGAYGAEVASTIEWVEVYDRVQKTRRTLPHAELKFGYRTSVFKQNSERYVVLRVAYRLNTRPAPNTSYKDVRTVFGDRTPTLGELRETIIQIRARKFPNLAEYGTAGSFFLNPVVDVTTAAALKVAYPELPQFPGVEGVKVSLAWMLDHVVHAKGMRVGGAFVWHEQPLVLATDHGATSSDVRTLARMLTEKVFALTNVAIVPEVTFW